MYGPLTVQERVDFAGALGAWATAKAAGANVGLDDLMPRWEAAAGNAPQRARQSPEQLMAFMRALQRKPKRRRKD